MCQLLNQFVNMYSARRKISKAEDASLTDMEELVTEVVILASIRFSLGYCTWKSLPNVLASDCALYLSSLQALFDLEHTNQELQSDLKDLYIDSAA